MTKPPPLSSSIDPRDDGQSDDSWARFLADEGLEALAAYRAIGDPEIRKMHVRMMRESARAEQNKNRDIN